MAVEAKRLCGWRKINGLYLCGEYISVPCDRLPLPLTSCPVCGQGIKVSRGFTKINPYRLWGNHDVKCIDCGYAYAYYPDVGATDFVCQHPKNEGGLGACPLAQCKDVFRPCFLCDPKDEPAYIMLVGAGNYKTPEDFLEEAGRMGVSKCIPFIPKDLELGKTIVYLAHPKACEVREPAVVQQAMGILEEAESNQPKLLETERITKALGIFCAFIPKRIEKLIKESEATPEELEKLEKRGIAPVIVKDGDEDHA